MTGYRITLGAFTTAGRPLTTEQIVVRDTEDAAQALIRARDEFLGRTALVSGVRLVLERIEHRGPDETYRQWILARYADPGTWVHVHGQWRRVSRWEPQGDGMGRLYTGGPQTHCPRDEGIYAHDDVFETR